MSRSESSASATHAGTGRSGASSRSAQSVRSITGFQVAQYRAIPGRRPVVAPVPLRAPGSVTCGRTGTATALARPQFGRRSIASSSVGGESMASCLRWDQGPNPPRAGEDYAAVRGAVPCARASGDGDRDHRVPEVWGSDGYLPRQAEESCTRGYPRPYRAVYVDEGSDISDGSGEVERNGPLRQRPGAQHSTKVPIQPVQTVTSPARHSRAYAQYDYDDCPVDPRPQRTDPESFEELSRDRPCHPQQYARRGEAEHFAPPQYGRRTKTVRFPLGPSGPVWEHDDDVCCGRESATDHPTSDGAAGKTAAPWGRAFFLQGLEKTRAARRDVAAEPRATASAPNLPSRSGPAEAEGVEALSGWTDRLESFDPLCDEHRRNITTERIAQLAPRCRDVYVAVDPEDSVSQLGCNDEYRGAGPTMRHKISSRFNRYEDEPYRQRGVAEPDTAYHRSVEDPHADAQLHRSGRVPLHRDAAFPPSPPCDVESFHPDWALESADHCEVGDCYDGHPPAYHPQTTTQQGQLRRPSPPPQSRRMGGEHGNREFTFRPARMLAEDDSLLQPSRSSNGALRAPQYQQHSPTNDVHRRPGDFFIDKEERDKENNHPILGHHRESDAGMYAQKAHPPQGFDRPPPQHIRGGHRRAEGSAAGKPVTRLDGRLVRVMQDLKRAHSEASASVVSSRGGY